MNKYASMDLLILMIQVLIWTSSNPIFDHKPTIDAECIESSYNADRTADSLELVKFYHAMDGSNWKIPWDLSKSIKSWNGVIIDTSNRVFGLSLLSSGLSGELYQINLPQLQYLDLRSNEISGAIPDFNFVPELRSLELKGNLLVGGIPNFTNLPNLEILNLSTNTVLGGEIPNFDNLPHLTDFTCDQCNIHGEIPNFTNLDSLVTINISHNQLVGRIPDFSNLGELGFLLCSYNNLEGSVPDFTNLPNINSLLLNNNSLSGSIPDFRDCPLLSLLQLNSNNISGAIPNFSNLPNLKILRCNNNLLTDTLPNFYNSPLLVELALNDNDLYGLIPNFSNLPNLEEVHLGWNNLRGLVPSFIQISDVLRRINFLQNNFTFESILPHYRSNHELITSNSKSRFDRLDYNSQNEVFHDSVVIIQEGERFSLDLMFDDTVTTNTYYWFKDNQPFDTIIGDNELTINNVQQSDEGKYRVEITNSIITDLTLYSHNIQLVVEGTIGTRNLGSINTLSIHPNPFSQSIHLKSQSEGQLRILSMDGNEIFHSIIEESVILTTSNWPNGAYLIYLFTDEGLVTETIVKLGY